MNRHAIRFMREYIDRLAVGGTITTRELAQYVNSRSRCFGVTTSEAAHFLAHQEFERIAPGVWLKVLPAQRRTMKIRCRSCHETRFRAVDVPDEP